ncbi:MAG: agmatinase [Desulfovibrionaceae bacterium]|nr:agmatinase [Desulfovibrionaceae bacterium]
MEEIHCYDKFLGEEEPYLPREDCRFYIISAPYEATVSYEGGTAKGPAALIAASDQLEFWDGESIPWHEGIYTGPIVDCEGEPEEVLGRIEAAVHMAVENGSIPVTLGGEHTISLAPLRALTKHYGNDFGIVHFDAHGDLRYIYDDTLYSHGCVMRRACELGLKLFQVGVRSLCEEEEAFRKDYGVKHLDGLELARMGGLNAILADNFTLLPPDFPQNIYVSFDVDALSSAVMPATGTPDPGGLGWYEAIFLLEHAIRGRNVLGVDVVELAPYPGFHSSDLAAAKLTYNIMGIISRLGLKA